MIKLGSTCTDKATGLKATITHLLIEMDMTRQYAIQPRGLNLETGAPLSSYYVTPNRLEDVVEAPDVEMPVEVLGTEVEDKASGFKGMAITIVMHISGCIHVTVKPRGNNSKTGEAIKACDFDIRRLKGAAIKPMTDEQIQKDQQQRPSPCESPSFEK